MNVEIKPKKIKQYTLKIKLMEDELKNIADIDIDSYFNRMPVPKLGSRVAACKTYDPIGCKLLVRNVEQVKFIGDILLKVRELANEDKN